MIMCCVFTSTFTSSRGLCLFVSHEVENGVGWVEAGWVLVLVEAVV